MSQNNNIFPIRPTNGGGGDGGMIESRLAKLEAVAESTSSRLGTIEQDIREVRRDVREDFREIRHDMRRDFRLTWAGIILASTGLAALLAKGFGWL